MLFKKKSPPPSGRQRLISTPPTRQGTVFSYHASRSARMEATGRATAAEQQAAQNDKAPFWRSRLPHIAGLLIVLVCLVVCLRLSSHAKVLPVNGSSASVFLRSLDTYQKAAQKAFTSSLLNANKITVDTNKVAASLQTQFPELRAVSISLPLVGDQPVVYIQPAAPVLVLATPRGSYLLDATGRALINANQVARLDKLKLPFITDQSGLSVTEGQIALPNENVAFITEVAGQLKAKSITVASMSLPPGGGELQVQASGASYFVKYNLHGDARVEVGAYLAVKQQLDAQRVTPGQYIDVRVESRAYYR